MKEPLSLSSMPENRRIYIGIEYYFAREVFIGQIKFEEMISFTNIGVVTKALECNIMLGFALIPLGKAWTLLSTANYGLSSTTTVFL